MSPNRLLIWATSSASASSSGGRMPGRHRASIVLPAPGGPPSSTWGPAAGAGPPARAARLLLPMHLGEVVLEGCRLSGGRYFAAQVRLDQLCAGEVIDDGFQAGA